VTNHQAESDPDMPLLSCLSRTWSHIQGNLFPWLTEELGPLTETHKQVVTALEVAGVEAFVQVWSGLPGRPPCDRAALARAFVAEAVIGLPTTSMLIERLTVDKQLRRLCGWERPGELSREATFSRAFAEFALSELPSRVHEALIKPTHEDRLVGHISRDATAIEAREKPVKTAAPEASTSAQPPKRRRGRPRKGEVIEKKEPRRLERQADMSLAEMLSDLPTHCAVGAKRNAKGHTTSWIGYKLHLDVADGDIPISAVLTSASLHDSQAAIPLATMTASRVINLYDLMDSAYDLKLTLELARQLINTPRHLSQHPGGFVLTLDRLDELVPVEPAAVKARSRWIFQPPRLKRCSARCWACRCFRNRRCRSPWSPPASLRRKPTSSVAPWRRSNPPVASTHSRTS
jgi:hypothetical protein